MLWLGVGIGLFLGFWVGFFIGTTDAKLNREIQDLEKRLRENEHRND